MGIKISRIPSYPGIPESFICILKILLLYLYKDKKIINPKTFKI